MSTKTPQPDYQLPRTAEEARRPLTTAEAAGIAHVCTATIARWAAEGRFASSRPIASGSGRRRIDPTTFFAFLRGESQ